jgi:hypothetical protein
VIIDVPHKILEIVAPFLLPAGHQRHLPDSRLLELILTLNGNIPLILPAVSVIMEQGRAEITLQITPEQEL